MINKQVSTKTENLLAAQPLKRCLRWCLTTSVCEKVVEACAFLAHRGSKTRKKEEAYALLTERPSPYFKLCFCDR
jgi:hypothetical protein